MKQALVSHLVIIAELNVKPNMMEDFLDYTVPNLKICRSYPGNIAFDILIDKTRPETVLFHEVWESALAQQTYMAWRVEEGDLTKLLSLLVGEPKFTAYNSIDA